MSDARTDSGPGRGPLLIVATVLFGLAAVIAYNVTQMAPPNAVGVGPTAAMRIICLLLVILGVGHLVAGFKAPRATQPSSEDSASNHRAVAWVLAGLFGLIAALLVDAGFVLGSAWLFVATARAFGQRVRLLSPAIGLVLSSLVYLFFTKALTLSLPAGPLERLLFG